MPSGSASFANDTLLLTVTDQHASALTLFWQGSTETPPVANGGGLRCLDGLRRMYHVKNAHVTTVSEPPGDLPNEGLSVSARSAFLGDPLSPGSVRGSYATYRDPPNFACLSPATINNTNALRVVWGP